MQPAERWDGAGQRMLGCEWALERVPARWIAQRLVRYPPQGRPLTPAATLWFAAAWLAGCFAHSAAANEVSTVRVLVSEATPFPALLELTVHKSAPRVPSQADQPHRCGHDTGLLKKPMSTSGHWAAWMQVTFPVVLNIKHETTHPTGTSSTARWISGRRPHRARARGSIGCSPTGGLSGHQPGFSL